MSATATQFQVARRMRRSKRLGLSISVRVFGQDKLGENFHEFTRTLSVSAHGGLLSLGATVQKGQTLLVENRNTREEQEFRVVYVKGPQAGKWTVGIEFAHVPVDFWKINFPPVGSKRV